MESSKPSEAMRARTGYAAVLLLAFALEAGAPCAHALGKGRGNSQPSAPSAQNRKVIALEAPATAVIELPDGSPYRFGEDFYSRLSTQLMQSGGFIVMSPSMDAPTNASREHAKGLSGPSQSCGGWVWEGAPSMTPAATLKFQVSALSFSSGDRGDRMFYGFSDRYRNPFNDGSQSLPEEFPLRGSGLSASWFDRFFDDRGRAPFDSQSGLDLGEGLNINFLFAWLGVKYALYHSEIHLELEAQSLLGASEKRGIRVQSSGYFYDVVAGYNGYSLGVSMARKDAMLRALGGAIEGAFQSIAQVASGFPLIARIDHVITDATTDATGGPVLLLGTGQGAAIQPAKRYVSIDDPSLVVEIQQSCVSGSTALLVSGDARRLKEGMLLKEQGSSKLPPQLLPSSAVANAQVRSSLKPGASSGEARVLDEVALDWKNIPKAGGVDGNAPGTNILQALWESIAGAIFLPYRVWRYFQYDQAYHLKPDQTQTPSAAEEARYRAFDAESWAADKARQAEPHGLASSPRIVAVIDTGVDYNHPALHDSLWLNPVPSIDEDGQSDRYGWDFISNDSRPFDDGYHGTEVASLVLKRAPSARIMALKAFNPWGVTQSSALYGAFQYAVDHGARIILCAWAGRPLIDPKSIEMGVQYAQEHGVLVVAAAGDQGMDLEQDAAYPAALSARFDNLATVTSVDDQGELVQDPGRSANYSSQLVTIAAPGKDMRVAEPLGKESTQTSTAYAAALVAGELARLPWESYSEGIRSLKSEADSLPGLVEKVQGGLVLRFP